MGAASRRELSFLASVKAGQKPAAGRRSHVLALLTKPLQMIRSVIAFNTARVRSRVPSLSRMVET